MSTTIIIVASPFIAFALLIIITCIRGMIGGIK